MAIKKSIAQGIIIVGVIIYLIFLGLSILFLCKRGSASSSSPEPTKITEDSVVQTGGMSPGATLAGSLIFNLLSDAAIFIASFGIWVMV